jgi:hypothetical protein
MSGGRLLSKQRWLGVIPSEHVLGGDYADGFKPRDKIGMVLEEGREWRVPMRPRVSLEGDVDVEEKTDWESDGREADLSAVKPGVTVPLVVPSGRIVVPPPIIGVVPGKLKTPPLLSDLRRRGGRDGHNLARRHGIGLPRILEVGQSWNLR